MRGQEEDGAKLEGLSDSRCGLCTFVQRGRAMYGGTMVCMYGSTAHHQHQSVNQPPPVAVTVACLPARRSP